MLGHFKKIYGGQPKMAVRRVLFCMTKGAMLIQSRTYNAFMPLLAAAAIYLIVVMVLTFFMNKLERRLRTSER